AYIGDEIAHHSAPVFLLRKGAAHVEAAPFQTDPEPFGASRTGRSAPEDAVGGVAARSQARPYRQANPSKRDSRQHRSMAEVAGIAATSRDRKSGEGKCK